MDITYFRILEHEEELRQWVRTSETMGGGLGHEIWRLLDGGKVNYLALIFLWPNILESPIYFLSTPAYTN